MAAAWLGRWWQVYKLRPYQGDLQQRASSIVQVCSWVVNGYMYMMNTESFPYTVINKMCRSMPLGIAHFLVLALRLCHIFPRPKISYPGKWTLDWSPCGHVCIHVCIYICTHLLWKPPVWNSVESTRIGRTPPKTLHWPGIEPRPPVR